MANRTLICLSALSLLAFAACSNDDSTGVNNSNNATVRFINATNGSLDVTTSGTVANGNGNLGFGGSSSCFTVNASNPGLGFQQTGTTTALTGFAPNFQAGAKYTVIAYSAADGSTQFATVNNAFTPGSGQAGLEFFNAANSGPFDVFVTDPGASLATANASNVAFGSGSNFFNVTSGSQQVRFTTAGTQNVAIDAGNLNFTSGQNAIVVTAPAATGTVNLRSFMATGC